MIRNYINESLLANIILESTNNGLYRARTIAVINDFFENSDDLYEEWPEDNPNHLLINEYLEKKFRDEFFHGKVHQTVMRLEPIIMSIALELGYEQEEGDNHAEELARLEKIVNYISSTVNDASANGVRPPFDLSKMTIENTTFDSLNEMFGTIIDKLQKEEDDILFNSQYNGGMNKKYTILSDIDFQKAHEYEPYTASKSVLCFTQKKSTWNKYINKGNNVAYLLLRDGWENEPEEHGKGTPYDDYGLSMIFLFVDGDGNLAYSTTRWNHDTNGKYSNVDHAFTKEYISNLLNVNFNSVFKGNNAFKNKVKNAIERVRRGEPVKSVFKDPLPVIMYGENRYMYLVKFDEKYNVVDEDGNLLFPNMWFEGLSAFNSDGIAWCRFNNMENFATANGEILSKKLWFDDTFEFVNGFALVKLNGLCNLIDKQGNILSPNQWFSTVKNFNDDGFAEVGIKGKTFFVDRSGNLYDKTGTKL